MNLWPPQEREVCSTPAVACYAERLVRRSTIRDVQTPPAGHPDRPYLNCFPKLILLNQTVCHLQEHKTTVQPNVITRLQWTREPNSNHPPSITPPLSTVLHFHYDLVPYSMIHLSLHICPPSTEYPTHTKKWPHALRTRGRTRRPNMEWNSTCPHYSTPDSRPISSVA